MQNNSAIAYTNAIWSLTNRSVEFDIAIAVVSNNGEIELLIYIQGQREYVWLCIPV